jgi:hypothetical protein
MPLTVNGTWAERQTIMGWLRQICGRINVDRNTGVVDLSPPSPGGYDSGCACLQQLINGPRCVTIQPIPGPEAPIPGQGGATLEGTGGGATTRPAGSVGTPAAPGRGPDGNIGGDNVTTFIDISNHDGHGYDHHFPMWFVLAHELTTGHALHNVTGTTGATAAQRERQAIDSEHAHAEAHHLPQRDPNNPDSLLPGQSW